MMVKRLMIFALLIVVAYYFYQVNQPVCKSCKGETMQIIQSCVPVRSTYVVYRQTSCFCDTKSDWKNLTSLILGLNYYKDLYGRKYPSSVFGSKKISCSDDELQIDVFEDSNVFLYVEQDTTKDMYDGALKSLFITDGDKIKYDLNPSDTHVTNKQVVYESEKVIVKYSIDYDQLNGRALIYFQQAIHQDSIYQKKFREVEYQLSRKFSNEIEAVIRYEDLGNRFYLKIL